MSWTDRLQWTRRSALHALVLATAAAAGSAVFIPGASATTLDEVKSRGYLSVATEDDFRPFEFVQDGKPTGYDNELLDLIRKSAPFEIRQDIIPWTGILPGVITGKYDMALTAVLITEEREKTLDFTSPVAEVTDFYVKRKGDDSIKTLGDLSGKTIGVQVGSAMLAHLPQLETKLKALGGTMGKVVEYPSNPEAYQDLALGRVDIVVNTVINLRTLVAEKPDVFELGEAVSAPTYVSWALKKGNKEILQFVNAALIAARRSGALYELQQKWFGTTFKEMPETWSTGD
jgi:polar amino acid transport system substrate-binding protein